MSMNLPVSGGRDFKSIPAGMHLAICNLLVDAGMQPGSRAFPALKHRLYLRFETPDQRVEYEHDGKKVEGPLAIGNWYVASMNAKATLRQHLEGWRGKKFSDEEAGAFDIETVLGKPCTIMVMEGEDGKTYLRGIGPAPKGCIAKAENPLLFYAPGSSSEALAKLPEWLRKKIENQPAPEPAGTPINPPRNEGDWADDSEIPF
ncbi:MAG: hypothetical protein EPN38_09365 [Rhodanobacteraceae bacterium]|nr:MAG: hypothetical protein EPN38_09365 [Rhodanobacteraceae bacterium]